jgi:FkbM family methyltransferase
VSRVLGPLLQGAFDRLSALESRHSWIRKTYRGMTRPLRHGRRRVLRGPAKGLLIDLQGSRPSYLLGLAEGDVAEFIDSTLRPGDVFYDLGANVGLFTLIAARLLGSGGHVYAFEPAPRTAEVLRKNVELNRFENVTIVEAAVSDRDGTMAFDEVGEVAQDARLAGAGRHGTTEVRVMALDSFVAAGARPPTLMKIDVEGHENEAIDGMVATLRSSRPIVVCEIHQSRHDNEHEVERMLLELGYALSWLEPGMHRQAEWWGPHVVAVPHLAGDAQQLDDLRLRRAGRGP